MEFQILILHEINKQSFEVYVLLETCSSYKSITSKKFKLAWWSILENQENELFAMNLRNIFICSSIG